MSLLQMFRGDTATYTVTFVDGTGTPVDLDGIDVTFTAKRNMLDTVPFIQKELEQVDSGSFGACTLIIESWETDELTHTERFLWDIQLDSGMDVQTPLTGRLVVAMDVNSVGGS